MGVFTRQRLSPPLSCSITMYSVHYTNYTLSWAFSHFPSSSHATAWPWCVSTHTNSSVSYRHFSIATQDEINPDHHLLSHRWLNSETSILYTNILDPEPNSWGLHKRKQRLSQIFLSVLPSWMPHLIPPAPEHTTSHSERTPYVSRTTWTD